jgi:hypothetical protein
VENPGGEARRHNRRNGALTPGVADRAGRAAFAQDWSPDARQAIKGGRQCQGRDAPASFLKIRPLPGTEVFPDDPSLRAGTGEDRSPADAAERGTPIAAGNSTPETRPSTAVRRFLHRPAVFFNRRSPLANWGRSGSLPEARSRGSQTDATRRPASRLQRPTKPVRRFDPSRRRERADGSPGPRR